MRPRKGTIARAGASNRRMHAQWFRPAASGFDANGDDMKLFGALVAASVLAGAPCSATADQAKARVIQVAIYRGPASCEDCSEAVARAIGELHGPYRVTFVGPRERTDITPASLGRFQLYVQPGGGQDIDEAFADLGAQRVAAIRGFVAHGGGYLGMCMGAYLAGASDIGLIPDDLDSEVGRPGFSMTTIDDGTVPVRWSGRYRTIFYQDGPFLHARPGDRAYRGIATYRNGDVAAARYSRGKGMVVLSGPHPEADDSWLEDADIPAGALPAGTPIAALLDQFRS